MKELAEFLRAERAKRGLTIRDISRKAGISIDTIEILELGDYDRIGTALLIRSFVRAYCGAVGLDATPLLEQYEKEIAACDRQDENIKRYGDWSKPIYGGRRLGFLGLLLLCASLVGVLYGGIWIYDHKVRMAELTQTTMVYPQQEYPPDLPKDIAPRVPEKQTAAGGSTAVQSPGEPKVTEAPSPAPAESSPVVVSAAPAAAGKVEEPQPPDAQVPLGKAEEPSHGPAAPELSNPAVVMAEDKPDPGPPTDTSEHAVHLFQVEASQKTWMQVKIDDDKTYSTMLQPGDVREWKTRAGMSVVVGNAGGVRMKWDNSPLGIDGKPGQVLRFRLPEVSEAEAPKHR